MLFFYCIFLLKFLARLESVQQTQVQRTWSYHFVILLFIRQLFFPKNTIPTGICLTNKRKQPVKKINPDHNHSHNTTDDSYYLYLLFIVKHDIYERRQTIRETWLSHRTTEYRIGHKFIIGGYNLEPDAIEILDKENSSFGDLLILDYYLEDSFETLTSKVLSAIVWAGNNVNSTYFMKVDDDVYIILDSLIDILKQHENDYVVIGNILDDMISQTDGKWMEKNWKMCKYFLPYPMGMGYIMSRVAVHYIMENSIKFKLYRNEDMTIGSLLSAIRITMKNVAGARITYQTECGWWEMHGHNDETMKETYAKWIQNGTVC